MNGALIALVVVFLGTATAVALMQIGRKRRAKEPDEAASQRNRQSGSGS